MKKGWIKIKDALPPKEGEYFVKRDWAGGVKIFGGCFFDGREFEDDLKDCIGEIIEWRGMGIDKII